MALLIRLFIFATVASWVTLQPARASDEALQLAEQKIKAGLLYNFLKYTQWPARDGTDSTSPITVCLFQGDSFEQNLKPMQERSVNQRTISIKTISGAGEISGCYVLVVASAQRNNWAALRQVLAGKPTLTVSDMEGFTTQGGMIEFTNQDNRIEVKLSMKAIDNAGLRVEDRLLKLVTAVP